MLGRLIDTENTFRVIHDRSIGSKSFVNVEVVVASQGVRSYVELGFGGQFGLTAL